MANYKFIYIEGYQSYRFIFIICVILSEILSKVIKKKSSSSLDFHT